MKKLKPNKLGVYSENIDRTQFVMPFYVRLSNKVGFGAGLALHVSELKNGCIPLSVYEIKLKNLALALRGYLLYTMTDKERRKIFKALTDPKRFTR